MWLPLGRVRVAFRNIWDPESNTHAEMAGILSEALGREVRFVDIAPEAMREALARLRMPDWQADGLIEDYANYQRGEAAAVTTGVRDATGHEPCSLAQFAADYAASFLPTP